MNESFTTSVSFTQADKARLPLNLWWEASESYVRDMAMGQDALRKAPDTVNRQLFSLLGRFHNDGAVSIKLDLPDEYYSDIHSYLAMFPVYPSHHVYSGPRAQRPLEEVRKVSNFGSYSMDTIIKAPHLLAIANLPPLVDFIEAALGCVPTLYSVHSWWSFPQDKPASLNSQYFHRDIDDWRFVTVFLYLTDVGPEEGPHQYIMGSHRMPGMHWLLKQSAERGAETSGFDAQNSFVSFFDEKFSASCESLFAGSTASFTGLRGTALIANTVGIHRGLLPRRDPRLIFWARYGLGPNANSADREQGPISHRLVRGLRLDSPRARYINRLLVR